MKIHEYQGKELLRKYGVPVPNGIPAMTRRRGDRRDPARCSSETGTEVVVVKAQIHAGGRGKGGGVKVAKTPRRRARPRVKKILGMQLVTHQTGPEGKKVQRLLVEQGLDIARELYLGMRRSTARTGRVTVMASTEGGMEIEEVAAKHPEKILKRADRPGGRLAGLPGAQARLRRSACTATAAKSAASFLRALYARVRRASTARCSRSTRWSSPRTARCSRSTPRSTSTTTRCSATPSSRSCAISTRRIRPRSRPRSRTSRYITLDGNIGCMVNGAGLAMATMDIIKHYGGAAGELPRRRRRRHRGEGHRGVQDHHRAIPTVKASSSTSSAAS